MANVIESRLADMGIELPEPPPPVAAYVPYRIAVGLVHVSGQLPLVDGELIVGKLGLDIDTEAGMAAARHCAINLLAQLRAACGGDWERVGCAVKINGFVNSTPEFKQHPQVINGASEFLASAMGEAGKHARSAIGVSSLPLGAAVEVDGAFHIR